MTDSSKLFSTPTAAEFQRIFSEVWAEMIAGKEVEEIRTIWMSDRRWSQFMLNEGTPTTADMGGLIKRIYSRFGGDTAGWDFRREWLGVDVMFVSADTIWGTDTAKHYYPSRLHVLIEHENKVDWDSELWKLIHLRAPLKVLIGYKDHGFDDWINGNYKETISTVWDKITNARQSPPHRDFAEYLLISGLRPENMMPKWKFYDEKNRTGR